MPDPVGIRKGCLMIHAQDPIEGVVHLDLSPEEEKKLVDGLLKSFEQALKDREESKLDEQAQNAVLQYHSALDIEEKDPQGSHLDLASTRKLTEGAGSRFMNAIFQRDQIVMGKPRYPQWTEFAKTLRPVVVQHVEEPQWMKDAGINDEEPKTIVVREIAT